MTAAAAAMEVLTCSVVTVAKQSREEEEENNFSSYPLFTLLFSFFLLFVTEFCIYIETEAVA